MMYDAFVFDLDGTLVDSKIDFDSMKAELQIARDDDVLSYIEGLPNHARESAMDVVAKHERAGAVNSSPIAGAREFIEALRSTGRPCAIFTRNSRELASESLKQHGFSVDLIIAREDAPPKPKPDGLLKIASAFGVEMSKMLFVGDYIYDLHAGIAAGAPTALYLSGEPDFDTTGAHLTFSSYDELTQKVFGR